MSTKRDLPSPAIDAGAVAVDARANRRWLIGICITVVFGGFAVVMAILSYTGKSDAPPRPSMTAPASAPASAPAADDPPEPARRDRGKGHGRK